MKRELVYVNGDTPEHITNLIDRLDEVDEQTWFGEIDGKWYVVEWSPREGEPVDEGLYTIIEFEKADLILPGKMDDHTITLLLLTLFDYAASKYLGEHYDRV